MAETCKTQMPIFCINLAKRTDRWAHMGAEATQLSIDLTRIEAITAAQAAAQSMDQDRQAARAGRDLSANQAACFQSHRAAWQALVDAGDDHGIVIEDDVQLARAFTALSQTGWIPRDADIVRLEAFETSVVLTGVSHLPNSDRRIGRLYGSQSGAAGYTISRAAAQRLLSQTERFHEPVDMALFHRQSALFKALRIYQLVPAPVQQGHLSEKTHACDWAVSSISSNRHLATATTDTRASTWPGMLSAWLRRRKRRLFGQQDVVL